MSIKDILVHVDSAPACDERVALATRLAHRFKAFLTGVFVVPSPAMLIPPDSGAAAVAITNYIAELEQVGATIGQQFLDRLHGEGLDGAWHLDHGTAAFNIARRARPVDLVIVGQDDPNFPSILMTPEDVILSCGRPVLVVPYARRFEHVGESATIAWNGSRECARAAHDSVALLTPQKRVTVVTINPEPNDDTMRDDMVHHLMRRGLDAGAETHVAKDRSPAALLLSLIADAGNDLIVMGAYGHSRLRETVLGGMTREMLRNMTVPVLMSH